LCLGEATGKTHVSNVLAKLGIRDRTHAVIWAYENGVVRVGEGRADR
ncbi:response regulator transcription factor, partial [Geobacillus sp. MMMUD3]|nr:response regulator transcription factor [Geobacillus sp. MMMUD3]